MTKIQAALIWLCCLAASCTASMKTGDEQNVMTFFTERIQAPAALRAPPIRENSEIRDRPYMVSMWMKPYDWMDARRCEGAILRPDWVITSGRCCLKSCGVLTYPVDKVKIRSGSKNLDVGGTLHDVEHIYVKDGYSFSTIENNLCLLKIKQKFTFGDTVTGIQLSDEQDYEDEDHNGSVSGWSNKDGTSTDPLKTVNLPLITNTRCQELYSATGKSANDITDKLLCAATYVKDACHGVAGGPLVVDSKLAGVVTTGNGCDNKPGVYTRISEYTEWIHQHIGEDSLFDVPAER